MIAGIWRELDGPRQVAFGVIALGLLAGAVVLALHRARPPERCADGLVGHGARCCGAGQSWDGARCHGEPSRCAPGQQVTPAGCQPLRRKVSIAAGTLSVAPTDWEAAQLGITAFEAEVAAFAIDSHEVTEAAYAECVAAGACAALPEREPGLPRVAISAAEAAAYCRFAGGRLPTPDEWMFAATGAEGRRYPWGPTGAVCRRAAFGLRDGPCASGGAGPEVAGSHPDGATPDGLHDLAGNAAEWTAPAQGTSRVKGGSWSDATATDLRYWNERRVDATTRDATIGFRCVYPPAALRGSP